MSRIRDEIDQLTRRLTTPAEAMVDRPRVMVLLMGHLPVRAGLWRLPAARRLLPDVQNIVVARVHEDELCIECIGEVGTRLAREQISIMDRLPPDTTLVLVPSSGAGPEVISELSADRVALVTGSDQAAVVGAYRLLKGMVMPPEMEIELLIAGNGIEQASETVARLGDAAMRHLGRTITFAGAIPTIEADTGLSGSCSIDLMPDGLLELARRVRLRRSGGAVSRHGDSPPSQRVVSAGATEAITGMGPVPGPGCAPDRVEKVPHQDLDQDHCPSLAPRPPRSPVPESIPEARVVPAPVAATQVPFKEAGDPDSTGFLCAHLPSLKSLDIRCPGHESVELAIDDQGGLHLVVPPSQAIQVPAVIGWIESHRSLLEKALPTTQLDLEAGPVVHVLGEDVDLLCSLRQSPWRPHLLVRVDPDGPTGWASVCLGRD